MFNFMQKTFTSLQVTTLYKMGILNLSLTQYPTAIEYFTQVIELDAKHADAFYQRGIAFKEMGEQQKATLDFQQAVKLNPKLLDDMFASAIANVDFKLYPAAIEKFDYILEVNPKLDKVFTQRALAKCALRAYKEAIRDFDEAIKLKPAERTYCDRGNTKAALGLYEEAMVDYQQALQLNPQSTYALLSRGVTTYQLGGRYHQALDDFKKVRELDSTYAALALYHAGLVAFELGDFKGANLALYRSIKFAESNWAENVNTYVMSGIVKLIAGLETAAATRFDDACWLISKQIASDPSNIYTKIELFENLESMGITDQLLESSIQKNYDDLEELKESINETNEATHPHLAALAYYYIARAYQINAAFDKAEKTFLQSIKLEENSRVIYEYANLLIKQEKIALAISKLQRAIELSNDGKCITYYRLSSPLLLNPQLQEELKLLPRLYIRVSVLATWQLINCYIVVGDKNNAEQQLNNLLKAVEAFPSPLAYSLLGHACQALKQWHLAARSFKTAVLLRANYSLAQQNLRNCLNQLSVQEDEIKPEITAQIQQLLVSENSEPVKQEQESILRSTNPIQLSDNKQQEIDKQTATERSKLDPKQHSSYESMNDFHKVAQLNPKLIDDLYNAGKDSLESEQYQTAIVYFTCVIELDAEHVDPRDSKRANAFYKRGIAFKKMGEQQKATSDFQQAVQLNSKLLDFIRDPQAQAYCDQGNTKAALGHYDKAMADYDNALLNPQGIKKLLRRGITTYQLDGRYHQALIDFNKVLQLNPNHALALYHRGMVQFELGDYESADANFRASIRNQNDNADVYIMLAIVKQMQKDPSADYSIENAYNLIKAKETKMKMLELCISSEYYKNEVAEKIADLETALSKETYSGSPMALAHYYLGRTYQMKGEFTQAEQNFLQSIKTAENSMFSYEYANFLVQQGKIALAIPQLLHALKLSIDGKCVTYYTLCPPLLSLSKELQEEIMHSYHLYIRVSVVATWQLINCYIAVGEKNHAEQQLNNLLKAVEEFPTPLAYSLLGYACQALKQWYLAAKSFKTAVLLRANYSLAKQNLQTCLNQLSVQGNEIKPFEIIAQIQQLLGSQNPKFLDDMFNSAMTDVDFKLYQSAIEKFDYILGVNPKLYKVYTERALAKCALRTYKEAIQDFDEAIKLKPEEHTYCDRGNAKAALGLYEEAMADYQQALQLNPQSTYALLNRGVTTYQLGGRYYHALYDFKKVLQLDPTYYASALYHDGLVRFELGDFKNADLALGRSITIAENKKAKNVNPYVMSGIVKLTTGLETAAATQFKCSCELISKKIAFDPSDIHTKIELLENLESMGVDVQLLESSIQENYGNLEKFKESINEATPPHLAALAYYYIARAYQINAAFDKAEENFLQSIKLEENSRVNYEYANLLIKQKKWVLAISKLQRAIELSNDGKCITYYRLSSPLLLYRSLREELKLLPRLYIRVSVLATWQLINCYIAVDEKSNAEQQLTNLLKAVEDFPSPLAYSLQGYAYQAFEQWHLAARSFKTAVLLRANYSLAQQNLQNCLNQLSIQEDEIKPFEIIAQIQQLLVSQNSELVKQGQESTIRSTNSLQLSDNNKQEIDKETATERSKLDPKQHSSYESMSNRTSSEANSINEIKSPTYYEFYQLTDSHKSGEQLLKLPMEEFVSNQNQKSPQQKSETEAALPPVPNLPHTSKGENEEEPDDGQDNRFQI